MSEICQLVHLWQNSDSFSWSSLTVFWHIFCFWHYSEGFPNVIWQISDRILNLTDFWHITDTFQIDFWLFFVTDRFLTVFRQISDSFLKFVGPTLIKSTRTSNLWGDRRRFLFQIYGRTIPTLWLSLVHLKDPLVLLGGLVEKRINYAKLMLS